jgi:hypothetical protein
MEQSNSSWLVGRPSRASHITNPPDLICERRTIPNIPAAGLRAAAIIGKSIFPMSTRGPQSKRFANPQGGAAWLFQCVASRSALQ